MLSVHVLKGRTYFVVMLPSRSLRDNGDCCVVVGLALRSHPRSLSLSRSLTRTLADARAFAGWMDWEVVSVCSFDLVWFGLIAAASACVASVPSGLGRSPPEIHTLCRPLVYGVSAGVTIC